MPLHPKNPRIYLTFHFLALSPKIFRGGGGEEGVIIILMIMIAIMIMIIIIDCW